MAYVAVDGYCEDISFGEEYVYEEKPIRDNEDKFYWSNGFNCVPLPKGSIKKLIGRELTWSDDPVELVEE